MIQMDKPKGWRDLKDIVKIGKNELLGVRFKMSYTPVVKFATKPYIASYDGNGLFVNARFGKDENGNEDNSVIVIPINLSCFGAKQFNRIHVKREFFIPDADYCDGMNNVVYEEDLIIPEDESSIYSEVVINAMRGNDGANGKSAYELAVDNGFVGTEQEWLESLKYKPTQEEQDEAEQHAIEMATTAAVTAANAVIAQHVQQIETLQAMMNELIAAEGTDTAESTAIDSQKEVNDFLEGIDNDKKLVDMMPQMMTEEELNAIRNLIK